MYLGVSAEIGKWSEDEKTFSIFMENNPLSEFVMLPIHLQNSLWYSNLICGVIKGALE